MHDGDGFVEYGCVTLLAADIIRIAGSSRGDHCCDRIWKKTGETEIGRRPIIRPNALNTSLQLIGP